MFQTHLATMQVSFGCAMRTVVIPVRSLLTRLLPDLVSSGPSAAPGSSGRRHCVCNCPVSSAADVACSSEGEPIRGLTANSHGGSAAAPRAGFSQEDDDFLTSLRPLGHRRDQRHVAQRRF